MQHFLRLTVCVLFVTCHLLGCQDPVDTFSREEIEPVDAVRGAPPIAGLLTAEKTFTKLRRAFPNKILNANFKTLRKVTTSKTYLDFILRAYPTQSPFQTLEEYFQVASPDAERYTTFLKEWVDVPTDEEVRKFHQATVAYRCANLILFRMRNLQRQDGFNPNIFRDVHLIFGKKIGVMQEIGLLAWLADNRLDQKAFFRAFEEFVSQTEREDAVWLHEQFEVRNGVDDGLLWSALLKPALIGEILTNFSRPDLFLTWINEKSEIE